MIPHLSWFVNNCPCGDRVRSQFLLQLFFFVERIFPVTSTALLKFRWDDSKFSIDCQVVYARSLPFFRRRSFILKFDHHERCAFFGDCRTNGIRLCRPKPMVEQHSAILHEVCRIGGKKFSTCTQHTRHPPSNFKESILKVSKVDVSKDDPDTHPAYVCVKCHRALKRAEESTDYAHKWWLWKIKNLAK